MGTFNSLQIAKSGLFASQKALEVTGHNIANANTEGYTRQKLELSAIAGLNTKPSSPGGGVTLDRLAQIRDRFLDLQYRNENSLSNELNLKTTALEHIEGLLAEPSDFGINAAISDLFNSIEQLSYNSQESSLREIVVQNAIKLTDTFQSVASSFLEYQNDLDRDISLAVDEINGFGEQIRDLNNIIYSYENKGMQANDLRDKRNLLLDYLSSLVPISTEETPEGKYSVKIGGLYLVDHNTLNTLEVKGSDEDNPLTGTSINKIYWSGTENLVEIKSGQIRGLQDIRDGATQDNQGLPYYMQELDLLAAAMVQEFNRVNNAGFTLPNGANPSTQNVNFFDPTKTLAKNITVSEALLESGNNIATSDQEVIGELNWGNNNNAQGFNDIRDAGDIVVGADYVGNLEERLQSFISDVAITTNYYRNRNESQQMLTNHIESQRLAISEVSVDEEMTNLVQYQHSYNAAAKVISIIDEMLTSLINM